MVALGNGLPLNLTGATAATRYVGGTASGAPASGTFAVGDFVVDQTGIMWICTVAGTPGTWVNNAQSPALPWVPGDNNLLASNGDPAAFNNVQLLTAGTRYMVRVNIRTAFTWTNVILGLTAAGSGTSTGSFVGLISSAGALLSGSSDQATQFNSAGTPLAITCPLTTPQAMTPGTFVWVVVLSNLSVTQPTFQRSPANPAALNAGLAAAAFRSCVNGTAQTTLGAITPGNNTATNSQPLWVGAT